MEGVDNRPIAMDKVAVEEIYIHGIIIIIIVQQQRKCWIENSFHRRLLRYLHICIYTYSTQQQPQLQHHLAKHLVVDFTQILQFITAFNYIGQPFHWMCIK